METRIRKCANSKCATVIPASERANKKFCSETCKNRAHNEDNKKGKVTWNKILDKYYAQPKESFLSLDKWLEQNYYPPRIIKNKKQYVRNLERHS
jgi:hypothetical protein